MSSSIIVILNIASNIFLCLRVSFVKLFWHPLAFKTSKKHLIGAVFSLLFSFLFIRFNWLDFNHFIYKDTYFLIGDFETWPIIIQSIVVFFIGWFV